MTQGQFHRHLWTGAESTALSASRSSRFFNFEISLQPRWRSWAFFLAVAAAAVFLGGEILRVAYVSVLGESGETATLEKAIALDPSNPELHHRLGMVLCDSLGEADRAEGLKHLHRAIELNPYAARYWSDLAFVCELDGDTACATQAVERAVKLSPATPELHWVAANTLLRAGQTDAAMAEFRRLLQLDASYAPATFHLCLGSLDDPQIILEKVLPPGKDLRLTFDYLNFLLANSMADKAHQVWIEAVKTGTSFPLNLASPYIEHLLALGRFGDAQEAWRDMERLGVISNAGIDAESNLVFNGDFEQTPLGVGFDWRNQAGPYIALDFSDAPAHSGKYCLRIDFTVSRNEEYTPLYQYVPVASDQTYLLTAYVRSQNITSDSGPQLRITDPVHQHGLNLMTEGTTGTTAWHPITLKFCTGPDTKIVQIAVTRIRSRAFPTEITGSFWLDTVALKSLGPATGNGCAASDH